MDSIIPSSDEGMVCQTCGDTGFTNAFIYCVKCLGYVIHRYCLDEIPKTHDEFVFWYCEDCKPAGPYKFALPKRDPSGPNKEDPTGTAIVITHSKKKQKKKVMKRQKKKSQIVHMLAGKDEVSCPLEDDAGKLASGTKQLDRCVVLGLTKGASQNQSLESTQLINCSPLEGSALLDYEPLQTQKEKATTSPHVKTTPRKKLKEKQKKLRETVSLVAGKEDKISCPQEVRDPNHQYISPTNPLLKEALLESDSGPNETTPCVENGVFQKQSSDSAEWNNCSPLKENAKRKSDATSLAKNTKKYKTQKDMDPIDHSSCDSSCTDVTRKNKEEQRCEVKQSKSGHDNLVSDASVGVLSKKTKVYDAEVETANRRHNEQNARVSRDGAHASIEELSKNTKNYSAEVETANWKGNKPNVRVSRDGADASVDELSKKTKDYDANVETANRMHNKQNVRVSRDDADASIGELSKKTKDHDAKVESADQMHNRQNVRVSRNDADASIDEISKKTKEYDAEVEIANRMHNKQNVRVSGDGSDAPQTADFKNNVEYIHHQPARPVLTPVWRGSFDIAHADYTLFEGFVGHLSSKACFKVCQEATTLPSLLCLEMQPKVALWPKSFLESQPSDENIALYFFPGDRENERRFEQLVNDMIDEELAMKMSAKNAELLIFTSRVLPQPYWRFQGKYYLWGVFRGKRNESSSTVVHDFAVTTTSDNRMPETYRNEVPSGKEKLARVKSVESMSPQSHLCDYR